MRLNEGVLRELGVFAEPVREGTTPGLRIETGTRVGAVPLRSPVTGRADFGLVVVPRFDWSGLGDLLATTGFRVVPEILPLPELPESERHIPPWVLASVVLRRLEKLLDATARRFIVLEADLPAPRGAVDWTEYAVRRLSRGRALEVPCRFPDLRDDEELRGAVHWAVRRHREELLGAPAGGRVVRQLIELCDRLLVRLAGTPPCPPTARQRAAWHRQPFVQRAFKEGISAIDWTADERGLAGLSDLAGLSWRLEMAAFFEAWVEAIAALAAARVGAILRTGREGQTRVPLDWRPRRSGSQGSLVPDMVMVRSDVVVILDAKYKRHAEQIDRLGWHGVDDRLREQHRGDLLQALAYSSFYAADRIVSLLVYPCTVGRWRELARQDRVLTVARARGVARRVEVGLLAVPLGGQPEPAAALLERVFRSAPAE